MNTGTLATTGSFSSTRAVTLGIGGGTFAVAPTTTLIMNGAIGGSGSLPKVGSGTLTLTGTSNYTGQTDILNGTLQLGNGLGTGSISSNIDVSTNGVLAFNRNNSFSYGGVISGSGQVNQRGSGVTLLTGENTYTGITTVAAGTLQLGDNGNTGSIASDVNVESGGTLAFNRNNTFVYDGVISGTGVVNQIGTGSTVLTANNTYTGLTTISAGTLQLGNGGNTGSLTGKVNNNGTLAFNRGDTLIFNSTISGNGLVDQRGSGTTVLTTANNYLGGTLISAGTLQLGNGGNTGSILGDVNNAWTLAFNRSDDYFFDGLISGTGGLRLFGTGIATLTANNTYSGSTSKQVHCKQAISMYSAQIPSLLLSNQPR